MEEEIEDLIGEMTYSESVRSVAISKQCSLESNDSEHMSSGKGTYVLGWDSEDSDGNFTLHESASVRNLHEIPRTGSHAFCVIEPELSSKAAGTSQHTIIAYETCTQTSKTIIELAENACGSRKMFEVNTLQTQTSFVSVTGHGHKELSYGLEASSGPDLSEESDTGLVKKKPSLLDLTCTEFVLESSGGSSSKFQPVSDLSNESTKESDDTENQNERSEEKYETQHYYNTDCDSFLYLELDEDSLVDYSEKSAKTPIRTQIEVPNQPDNSVDSVGEKSNKSTVYLAVTKNKEKGDTYKDYLVDSSMNSSQIVGIKTKTINNCQASKPPVHYFDQHDLEMRKFGTLSTLSEESTKKEEQLTKKEEESTKKEEEFTKKEDELTKKEEEFTNKHEKVTKKEKGPTKKEEKSVKEESLVDITPTNKLAYTITLADTVKPKVEKDEVVFTKDRNMNVKVLKDHPLEKSKEPFKLPSIQNQSCPNSPHLSSLFEKSKKLNKAGTLPSFHEDMHMETSDRWEIANKNLASGEGKSITGQKPNDKMQLPPIHAEGPKENNVMDQNLANTPPPDQHDTISIKERIRELKMTATIQRRQSIAYGWRRARSMSPGSSSSPGPESRLSEVADRGCEALCVELIKNLRSSSWIEVMKTLDELPQAMSKFWGVITETRIVDLLRQVNAQVESPRTQVARSACAIVAEILKNTNYTKKPDFHETISVLLNKTGSYSRPVRRAANIALDEVVCNVELSHAVTALCVHGCGHKSPLVRCASARLLIVCCAVSGGGRDLLRARPTSAASARRLALQSLSTLLEDRNPETRKYAERLYCLLRHLSNFEAYYLTDVDVGLASKQMVKYDQLLGVGPRACARESAR